MMHIFFSGEINNYRKGVGIQSLSGNTLSSIVIPLPPLAEQQRIVTQIETIFNQLNEIEQAIKA
ncbi:hypothetical protein EZS27_012853 [termite gut metagenome]|uniref:Type I restriction modification DNA specificity domain-containing protein n=1 Tax=termite gut metagenome TaxID=433724 RepID=A0A5J4RZE7_9ZZZZ